MQLHEPVLKHSTHIVFPVKRASGMRKIRNGKEAPCGDWYRDDAVDQASVSMYSLENLEAYPSKMNNHCQPARPWRPPSPLYKAACKYPLNMDAMALVCSKMAILLVNSRGPYQPPRRAAYPGKAHASNRPTKKRRA